METRSVKFTVFDPATGDIKRSGYVKPEFLDSMNKPGCEILPGVRADPATERIIVPEGGAKPYPRRRSASDLQARKPKAVLQKTINPQKLLAALEKAGIKLESADIY